MCAEYIKKRNKYIFADNYFEETCRVHRLVCLSLESRIP